jgi:hypothetical protein
MGLIFDSYFELSDKIMSKCILKVFNFV